MNPIQKVFIISTVVGLTLQSCVVVKNHGDGNVVDMVMDYGSGSKVSAPGSYSTEGTE